MLQVEQENAKRREEKIVLTSEIRISSEVLIPLIYEITPFCTTSPPCFALLGAPALKLNPKRVRSCSHRCESIITNKNFLKSAHENSVCQGTILVDPFLGITHITFYLSLPNTNTVPVLRLNADVLYALPYCIINPTAFRRVVLFHRSKPITLPSNQVKLLGPGTLLPW